MGLTENPFSPVSLSVASGFYHEASAILNSQFSILNLRPLILNSQFSQIRVIRVPRKPAFALHTLRQPYSILNSQLSIHHDPIHHSCRYIYLR